MLKNFENWLLEQKYSTLTAADYMGRIEKRRIYTCPSGRKYLFYLAAI